MYDDAAGKFAEIYGPALVGNARMFVVACAALAVAVAAVGGMYQLSIKSTATPWLVEVSKDGGVLSKPVRIESIQPNRAVVKAELAKFIRQIFTLDIALTPRYFREANVMTSGLATTKFSEFRVLENVAQRLSKEPDMTRIPTVTSVDMSQEGIAFVFLSTEETRGAITGVAKSKWRVTLKYAMNPPKTEAEILENPLGLYITDLNITQEGKAL
jgi:type IV secretory pathway TrbF-like protein